MPETKDKALHVLIEDEFQNLLDIIEQKQILHEDIPALKPASDEQTEIPAANDPIEDAAQRLQQHSRALGADTLAEYFHELEGQARSGTLQYDEDLLKSITDEFAGVKDILKED